MTKPKGWREEPKRHSLAARGIPTKSEIRTESPTTKNPIHADTNYGDDKEHERLLHLFADRNYKYDISKDVNNNGIYLTSEQALRYMKDATPNGCGSFEPDDIEKLSEVHKKGTTYMIKRDNGSVMVVVNGVPTAHPGRIREWIGAISATTDDNNIVTYKWASDGKTTIPTPKKGSERSLTEEEKLLMKWANEVNTGQTNSNYPEWIREGEQ